MLSGEALLSLLIDDPVECVARHGGVCICKHLSLAPFAQEQTPVPFEHQVKQMPGTCSRNMAKHSSSESPLSKPEITQGRNYNLKTPDLMSPVQIPGYPEVF